MVAFIVALLALSQLTLAQFVATPTNFTTKQGHANVTVRYKQVPAGVCELREDVLSFSGYADVAENQHIFWWFFEARNVDPSTAPLTVWINGGPGSSSMIGLFQELGPCSVNSSGDVVDNPYSWSNVSNMLFIDQPTQTGFSYSEPVPGFLDPDSGDIVVLDNNTCPDNQTLAATCGTYSLPQLNLTANSTPSAAPNMYKTIQGFMGAFPQYSAGDFYFATESYGGHYGPIFNQYFLEQNSLNASGTVPINLKAVLIGNGWFEPSISYAAYYNYTVSPGSPYDYQFYNQSVAELVYDNMWGANNCYDQLLNCSTVGTDYACASADNYCAENVEFVYDAVTGRDEYDSRYLYPDPFPYEYYVDYLNTPDVLAAIGAYVNFTEGSSTVGTAFSLTGDDGRGFNLSGVIGGLVADNITVVLYFGDADYICNYYGGLGLLPTITPQPANFSAAGFVNITSESSNATNPRGSVRQAGNFAFVRFHTSGHEVPFYQPEISLTMLGRVINGTDIATGGTATLSTQTVGPLEDTYKEGNSTVQEDIVPLDATYDWETGLPIIPSNSSSSTTTKRSVVDMFNLPARSRVEYLRRRAEMGISGPEMGQRLSRREMRKKRGLHHRAQVGYNRRWM